MKPSYLIFFLLGLLLFLMAFYHFYQYVSVSSYGYSSKPELGLLTLHYTWHQPAYQSIIAIFLGFSFRLCFELDHLDYNSFFDLKPIVLIVFLLGLSRFLMAFYHLPMKSLEASEKLEQLRYLEFGKRIKMVETTHVGIGIDTPEDLEKARQML